MAVYEQQRKRTFSSNTFSRLVSSCRVAIIGAARDVVVDCLRDDRVRWRDARERHAAMIQKPPRID